MLRDLVALSALPALWAGHDRRQIADSLADVVARILALDLAVIRLAGARDALPIEAVRAAAGGGGGASDEDLAAHPALVACLADPRCTEAVLEGIAGGRDVRMFVMRFGGNGDGESGLIAAAAARDSFPGDEDRLLLGVLSNHVQLALQRQRVMDERLALLEEARAAVLEARTLNELARALGVEMEPQKLMQRVTDAATELTGARFGAFFYNSTDERGEAYSLFTLSGAPREAFEGFGFPRNTPFFEPTFRGEGVVRIADVREDPRYGKAAPHFGMPAGHLPVRSYLAVPVISRFGPVLGGLFFGHPEPGRFSESSERMALGVASQAAIAIDNAQLYAQAQQEIEARRRIEESERAARTAAERASHLRDEFLATVSHELRTPLNGVLGWTQLLRRAPDDAEVRQQGLEAIERGARAQARIIEDLLDMSRIIAGKIRLEMQAVDLLPVVQAAVETVEPAAEAKEIRIRRELDPHAGAVRGDPARLQQVLWNLLSNAVKFAPRGGHVEVRLERVEPHVVLMVRDDGQGIAPEFLPHVFDRFRQADSSTRRTTSGLGLGLAVVKHLVELHGGRVAAESAGEGQGATFTVQLPLAPASLEAPPDAGDESDPQAREQGYLVDLAGARILLVDDDRDTCDVLRRVLTERGAEVEVALSGRAALEHIERAPYDVLVSDIGMPEMDGYELIREVRTRGRRLPAVAVTAFARSEDRVRALLAGYSMHVAKPIEPSELITVIGALRRGP